MAPLELSKFWTGLSEAKRDEKARLERKSDNHQCASNKRSTNESSQPDIRRSQTFLHEPRHQMFVPNQSHNNSRTLSGNLIYEPTFSPVFSNAFSDSAHFLRPIDAVDNTPNIKGQSAGHLSMGFGSLSNCDNQNSMFAEPDRSFSGDCHFGNTPPHRIEYYRQNIEFANPNEDEEKMQHLTAPA